MKSLTNFKFTRMRNIITIAILALLLAGCTEAKLNLKSLEEAEQSIAEIKENLSQADKELFQQALMEILMENNAMGKIFIGQSVEEILIGLKDKYNGLTAKEIIEIGLEIKEIKRLELLEDRRLELDEINKKIDYYNYSKAFIDSIEILEPKTRTKRVEFWGNMNVLSFKVKNNTSRTIVRISGHVASVRKESNVPFLEDEFNYTIPGGIMPGETRKLELIPQIGHKFYNATIPQESIFQVTLNKIEDIGRKEIASLKQVSKDDLEKKESILSEYPEFN